MLKKILYRLLCPFVTAYAYARFRGIWGIKTALRNSDRQKPLLKYVFERQLQKRGSWIGYASDFTGEPLFPHGIAGVFISNAAKVGRGCVIFHQVTIGSNTLPDSKSKGSPVIGDNVYIGAGAKIIGGITVGNNCRIGAGAVVYSDMPDNSVAVCAPTRMITKETPPDNRHFMYLSGGKNVWFDFEAQKWVEEAAQKAGH